MKRNVFILFVLSILLTIPVISLAHSGKTDSSGGHYDHFTGEYHYHHGYSAHQHPDGICPYDTTISNDEKPNNYISAVLNHEYKITTTNEVLRNKQKTKIIRYTLYLYWYYIGICKL